MMKFYLLLFYGVGQVCSANSTSSNEDYDLTNIFVPSFRNHNETLPEIPGVFYKNVTIDVEKVDIDKMKNKLDDMMQSKVMDMEDIKETRRQSLVYTFMSGGHLKTASDFMTRTKISDLMLQTIYMARHKMKALEADPNFSKTDTGYRIGYLYKMMRRILKKLKDILHIMDTDRYDCYPAPHTWQAVNQLLQKQIILHSKSVKLHNDFLYMWWVMIKVDGLFMDAAGQRLQLPKSLQREGGITDDEKEHRDINPASVFDLRPGKPVPHAEVLESIIRSQLGNGSEHKGLIFRYLDGDDDVSDHEDFNVNVLDVASVRKLIDVFEKRYEENMTLPKSDNKTRSPERRYNEPQSINDTMANLLIPKAFLMIQQSIYATRYRLQDTNIYRNQYKNDVSYNIAILVGSMDQIVMKMDNLLQEMRELPEQTHFLWYLIIYEKLLTMNIDVGYMANRIWALHKQFLMSMGGAEPIGEGPDMRPDMNTTPETERPPPSDVGVVGPPPNPQING